MPYTRKNNKKKYVKKRRPRPKKTSLPMVVGGFPDRKFVKLRYVQEIKLDAGTASFAVNTFSANGMYDPDITGVVVGHQPSNFDTWMSIYDHYTVLGARISSQFVPTAAANLIPAVSGILLSDTGIRVAGMTGLEDLLENPQNKRGNTFSVGTLYSVPYNKTTKNFSASKFFGKKSSVVMGDDDYRGRINANPTDQAYFELYAYSVDGNNPGALTYIVTIEYLAMLTERKPALSS